MKKLVNKFLDITTKNIYELEFNNVSPAKYAQKKHGGL